MIFSLTFQIAPTPTFFFDINNDQVARSVDASRRRAEAVNKCEREVKAKSVDVVSTRAKLKTEFELTLEKVSIFSVLNFIPNIYLILILLNSF
jgi:hypothetical protein